MTFVTEAVGVASVPLAIFTASAVPTPSFAAPASSAAGGELVVENLDHVGINVPNIDEAIKFFGELFGTSVEADTRPEFIGPDWKTRFDFHPSSDLVRFVMLRTPGGQGIELFQYTGKEASARQPHDDDAGATHIALKVHDVDAAIPILKKHGLRILNDPITNPDGVRWFYFLSPWNSQVELVTNVTPPGKK